MKVGNELNKVLHIRISEEEYRKLEEEAKKSNLTVSALVRKLIT